MSFITTAWAWLRIQIRDLRPQLRLCLRVTIAAMLSFVFGKLLSIPFGGLWAVLTAVVVTQTSIGGSLRATIEYLTGTLGGAVYAGAIATLVPHANEVSLLVALAIAVAPLALLAAMNPSFRVGPMTAVIVVVGSSVTHAGPVEAAVYRVLEVAIGGVTGLVVSLLVFPARAHVLVIEAAAGMLDLMAAVLSELLAAFMQSLDGAAIPRRQHSIGRAFTRLDAIGAEAMRERMAYLASQPDPGPLLRTLLRLRHDFVMIGRAAVVPLSEGLRARLGPLVARTSEAAGDYLRGSGAALIARRNPEPLDAVDAVFDDYAAEIAALRREGLTRDLSGDAVERFFALGFALEQLHRDFRDLEQHVTEYARSTRGTSRKATS
ncbi:MAG: FUSC family protein [Methylocella sp.]